MSGGDKRDRTADPLLARQMLYQLSYIPIGRKRQICTATPAPKAGVFLLHYVLEIGYGVYIEVCNSLHSLCTKSPPLYPPITSDCAYIYLPQGAGRSGEFCHHGL